MSLFALFRRKLPSLPLIMALERIEKWNGYWTGQMGDSPADDDAMEIVRSILTSTRMAGRIAKMLNAGKLR